MHLVQIAPLSLFFFMRVMLRTHGVISVPPCASQHFNTLGGRRGGGGGTKTKNPFPFRSFMTAALMKRNYSSVWGWGSEGVGGCTWWCRRWSPESWSCRRAWPTSSPPEAEHTPWILHAPMCRCRRQALHTPSSLPPPPPPQHPQSAPPTAPTLLDSRTYDFPVTVRP